MMTFPFRQAAMGFPARLCSFSAFLTAMRRMPSIVFPWIWKRFLESLILFTIVILESLPC